MNAPIPKSIDVWVCPDCGRWGAAPYPGWHAVHCRGRSRPLARSRRYVPAEPTDEMVERAARAIWGAKWDSAFDHLKPAARTLDELPADTQDSFRASARAALESAFSTEVHDG